MPAAPLIEDYSLQVLDVGYKVSLRLPWYRSLPLSCIENVHLSLNGQPVEADSLRISVADQEYRLSELEDKVEQFWFVQDSAHLIVLQPGRVKQGETYQLEVELRLRFPYIPIGPGKFLVNTNKQSVSLTAR